MQMTVIFYQEKCACACAYQKDLSPWLYDGANLVVFQKDPGPHFVCLCIPKSRCDLALFGKTLFKFFYPSSTTAKTSFHGTSISICQHPRPDYAGELHEAPMINDNTNKVKRVPELPESYTNVRPAHIAKNHTPHKEMSLTLPSPTFIQSHLKE